MNNIQPYQRNDKSELMKAFELNVPEYFDISELKLFENYLEEKGEEFYSIHFNNEVVGGFGVDVSNAQGSICWIFIHPDFKNKGLGRTAVDFFFQEIRNHPQIQKLIVRTSQMSYKFFEKFGFELLQTEKDYWAEGFDLYYMEKTANND